MLVIVLIQIGVFEYANLADYDQRNKKRDHEPDPFQNTMYHSCI